MDNRIVFYRPGAHVVSIEAVLIDDHRRPLPNCNLVLVLGLFYADKEIREVIRRSCGDALSSAKFVGFGVAAIAVDDGVVVAVTDCIVVVLNLNLLLLQERLLESNRV